MGIIVRKRIGAPSLEAAAVAVAHGGKSDGAALIMDWCECGNMITKRARVLQDPDPATKKSCFNCLLHDRKIGVAVRKKDGSAT